MKATLIRLDAVDDAFRAEWRALAAAPAEPANPFFCRWFLEPALRRLAPPGVRLLTIRDDAGRLAGLAPVERSPTYARLPTPSFAVWRFRHAYNGAPLFAAGRAEEGVAAILRWIDERPDGARFFRFNDLPASPDWPPTALIVDRAIVVDRRWRRACLRAGVDFETAYAGGYDGKKRKELRRQWKRLGERGALSFVRWSSSADVSAAAIAFLALEARGWKGRDEDGEALGTDGAGAAFFRAAMTEGAAEGAVFVDAAVLNGEPVAMLFSLRAGTALSAYKIAFDETYAAFSPGVQLLVEAMRRMLSDPGVSLFDSCAREGHPVVDSLWRDRIDMAQVNLSAARVFDRALLRAGAALAGVNGFLTERRTIGRNAGARGRHE